MRTWKSVAMAGLAALGFWAVPVFGADQARPGTVNYVEGSVDLDGSSLTNKSIGNAEMEAGQVLTTHVGKAEILLNPGIYLRVGDNSSVKMLSSGLTPTQVSIESGRAGVEVDELLPQNILQVVDHGVTTQLTKTGYYEFDANHPMVEVSKGQAEVQVAGNHWKRVKAGHELALTGDGAAKEQKFEANAESDPIMNWSKLRSQYLAQANNEIAAEGYGYGYGPGWYWDPGMWGYTFMGPGPFYSPFGWGFYPMGWYGGWGGWGGWYGRPGFVGRGFHGGGFHGGGFHGGFTGRR